MAYRLKEPLVTCPYESTHQILPHRMAQHIIKCKKNYPELDMKTCVFNATHVVPSKDYQAHIIECPNKAIVERDIYRRQEIEDAMEIKRTACISMPSVSECEETWDQESGWTPYNPIETMINREITRPPPPGLMGKSGRRAWRQTEIERIRRQKEGLPFDDLEYPDNTLTASTSFVFLSGKTSMLDSSTLERDGSKSSLTASKCNLAMRADQPLRRPKALLQKKASRLAANIFNGALEDSQKFTSVKNAKSICEADDYKSMKPDLNISPSSDKSNGCSDNKFTSVKNAKSVCEGEDYKSMKPDLNISPSSDKSNGCSDNEMKSNMASIRLKGEVKTWIDNPLPGFIAMPTRDPYDDNLNLLNWECAIPGKEMTPWENGLYRLQMIFKNDYPFIPPNCKFETPIFHPNVHPSGCVYLCRTWVAGMTIKEILLEIQDLLHNPNMTFILNERAEDLYSQDRPAYEKAVRAQARTLPAPFV